MADCHRSPSVGVRVGFEVRYRAYLRLNLSPSVLCQQDRKVPLRSSKSTPTRAGQLFGHRFICPDSDKVQIPYVNRASKPYQRPGIPIGFTLSRAALQEPAALRAAKAPAINMKDWVGSHD